MALVSDGIVANYPYFDYKMYYNSVQLNMTTSDDENDIASSKAYIDSGAPLIIFPKIIYDSLVT